MAGLARGNRAEGVEPVLSALTDADKDAGRERNREFSGGFQGCEPPCRFLVGCAPMTVEFTVEGLDHHPLASRHRPQQGQFVRVQRSSVGVREQTRLVEHSLRGGGEILDGGGIAMLGQPLSGLVVAQLGSFPKREQCLVTARRCSCDGDRDDLVERQIRRFDPGWWLRECAVVARVTTELSQWDEDLRRVRDPCAEARISQCASDRHQLIERGGEQFIVCPLRAHRPTITE